MSTAPYPWTHPDIFAQAASNSTQDPLDVIRRHINSMFSAPPEAPVPWMLLLLVERTRPNPEDQTTLKIIEFLPRVPSSIILNLPRMLRHDAVLDVTYAKCRGHYHPILATADALMADDFHLNMRRIPRTPDDPIAKAATKAATQQRVPIRHWQIPQGSRAWDAMRREQRLFDLNRGLPHDATERHLAHLAQLAPDEWVEYLDRIAYYDRRDP